MRPLPRRSPTSSSVRWACECTLVAAAAVTTLSTCLEAWSWAKTKFPAPRRIVFDIEFDPYVNDTCLAQESVYLSLNLSARVRAVAGHPTPISSTNADASSAVSLLSIDYHISPIADLKDLLRRHVPSAVVVDRSLSEACERAGTCATSRTFRMIRRGRRPSMYLTPAARRAFFAAYTDVRAAPRQPTSWVGWLLGEGMSPPLDPLVMQADAMVCSHPTGSCELVMPFNRPAIIWATTRFELGRECNARRMCGYVHNLRALASIPGSVVLANNMYDVHYTQYFTGITPLYVPSYCGYTGAAWRWGATGRSVMRKVLVHGFKPFTAPRAGTHANTSTAKPASTHTDSHELLYPGDTHGRGGPAGARNGTIAPDGLDNFLGPLRQAAKAAGSKWRFKPLRVALGSNYTYESLAAYPAVLHLPYQASIMSFFEHYRMGIPILAPSLGLLTRWHMDMRMVGERSWDMAFYHRVSNGSVLPRHPTAIAPYDPNDDTDPASVAWWLQWSDYYTFPHVILFDSWQDLLDKLNGVDLAAVSAAMHAYSAAQEAELALTWRRILASLPSRQERAASDARLHGLSYEQRMDTLFGSQGWADY